MKIKVLKEEGLEEALLGLSLSYNKPFNMINMLEVACKLADKDGGHNKFLESIVVWFDITAARYWWQQFDTYRVGMTKQSESTMHTVMKRELAPGDFEFPPDEGMLYTLNMMIRNKQFDQLKSFLPEGFLQRRIVCTNYQTLRRMILQRKTHKLVEWQTFIGALYDQLQHCYLLPEFDLE